MANLAYSLITADMTDEQIAKVDAALAAGVFDDLGIAGVTEAEPG